MNYTLFANQTINADNNITHIGQLFWDEDIRAAVGPFIVSLNGGPPFDYNINQVDDANDQAIINFVLVLEFLEVEFYRMNIERFFRVL